MLTYSVRQTGRSANAADYILLCNSVEVGRCSLRSLAGDVQAWSWSIYLGWHVKRTVEGVPIAGYAPTLDVAKQQFRACFERMIEAGVVILS